MKLSGDWLSDHGEAQCPIHNGPGLTLRNGRRAVLVECDRRCDRRAIVAALRARGILVDAPL